MVESRMLALQYAIEVRKSKGHGFSLYELLHDAHILDMYLRNKMEVDTNAKP